MRSLVFVLTLLVPYTFANDLASSFQQAVTLANEQESGATTKVYFSGVLLPYYAQKYAPVLQSCFAKAKSPDSTAFSFVAALDGNGRVVHIYDDRSTNISQCLLEALKVDTFPVPPVAPYYLHIDMKFGDDSPTGSSEKHAPPLVLSDNKYSYTFGMPQDWECDFEQAHARGANLAFFPKGGDFNHSDSVVYVSEIDPSCDGNCLSPLAQSIAKTLREVRTDSPTVGISTAEPANTKDGTPASIRILKGSRDPRSPDLKDDEALAFIPHEETTILVVLTSRNPRTWEQDYAAFRQIIAGHKFFTCNSLNLAVPCKP